MGQEGFVQCPTHCLMFPKWLQNCPLPPLLCKTQRNFGTFKIYKCLAHGFHGTNQRHSSTPTLASKDLVKIEPVALLFQHKGYSSKAPPILSSNAYLDVAGKITYNASKPFFPYFPPKVWGTLLHSKTLEV